MCQMIAFFYCHLSFSLLPSKICSLVTIGIIAANYHSERPVKEQTNNSIKSKSRHTQKIYTEKTQMNKDTKSTQTEQLKTIFCSVLRILLPQWVSAFLHSWDFFHVTGVASATVSCKGLPGMLEGADSLCGNTSQPVLPHCCLA